MATKKREVKPKWLVRMEVVYLLKHADDILREALRKNTGKHRCALASETIVTAAEHVLDAITELETR